MLFKKAYTLFMNSIFLARCRILIKRCFFLLLVLLFVSFAPSAFAGMTSTNYQVQWDVFSVGTTDTQSSSSYRVRSSLDSGVSSHVMTSSSYGVDGGYRGGIYDPVSTFRIYSQNIASQVAATVATSTTVTVSSVAAFAVGDRVLLVQDEGASQVAAMGEITDISGVVITADAFIGGSPVIDGAGGDYLYKMTADGTTLPLPDATWTSVATGIVGWEATADVPGGYSVYVFEGSELTTGTDQIPDVSDGSVTAGNSEYGARASDTTLASSTFDTQDTGITSSPQLVASQAQVSFLDRNFLTLKLGIGTSQVGGAYTQNLTLMFVGGY
jgi:hypothetical protein